ncbi:MAG: hypothetical protein JRF69_04270 [Deltaproteobacteria bacterium]|nr:hypothetical protein [Deltaproteobacteria bacterium]
MPIIDHKEFEAEDRIYIIPAGTMFFAVRKQPKPNKDAVFSVGVGDDCPMLESRLCIGINARNLTYRCKYLTSYGEKNNGSTVLEWVQCGYEGRPQKRLVKVLKTTSNCDVDEFGCIHPMLGEANELKRCDCLVGYVPSNLSVPHNQIVCTFLQTLTPE